MPGSKPQPADLSGRSSNNRGCLFLLRHGRIRGYDRKRFIGQTDVELDDTGRSQARNLQDTVSLIRPGKVYVSGLSRCRKTAALACPGLSMTQDERLNEIDLGEWDGLSFESVQVCSPDLFDQRGKDIFRFRPPGGESFADLLDRALPFFNALTLNCPTLVFTHAGVIRTMLCYWAGRPMEDLFSFKINYAQLFVLENNKNR